MNTNLRIVARGAVIVGCGAASIGGGIGGGELMAAREVNSAPYLERQAEECLQSLGASATRGPMPEDCKRVLPAAPINIHPPVYDLPSAKQVSDLPEKQASKAMELQNDARYIGFTLGGLACIAGLALGKAYEVRRQPKKEPQRSPAQ